MTMGISELAKKAFCYLVLFLFGQIALLAQISFIQNKGQWPTQVKYKADIPGGSFWIQSNGFAYELFDSTIFIPDHKPSALPETVNTLFFLQQLEYGSLNDAVEEDDLPGYFNYYLGSDSTKWSAHVKRFQNINFQNVYDGINLRLLGKSKSIKYQFELEAHANPNLISWKYHDSLNLELDTAGNLISHHDLGRVYESRPFAFQSINGHLIEVKCDYVLNGNRLQFLLGAYDSNYALIIDPEIAFSSFIGSSANNFGFTACDDLNGNLVSGASVFANNYPTTANAYSSVFNPNAGNYFDVAISKFDATGSGLLYSTYLGGLHQETPHSVVVDNLDRIVVFGVTGSSDFPTSMGAYQPVFAGGNPLMMSTFFTSGHPDGCDFFITKFNASGTLAASTFLGENATDGLNYANELFYNYGDAFRGEVNVDGNNNIFIGSCVRGNADIAGGSTQPNYGGGDSDGYVAKLNPSLSMLLWSSYFGGSGADAIYALEFANDGDLLLAGGTQSQNFPFCSNGQDPNWNGATDGFILRIDANTFTPVAGTFIGTGEYDQAYFLQTDLTDNVYCLGQTAGSMTITPGLYGQTNSGQFIRQYNPTLSTLNWNTTIGTGSGEIDISPTAFLVSDCNQIYFSGWGGHTNSLTCPALTCLAYYSTTNNLPITADAFQSTTDGSDFYLAVLNASATQLVYGSYLGGSSSAEHVDGGTSRFDKSGSVYQAVCAGCQNNDDFPTTPGAWSSTNNSFGCNLAVFRFDLGQLEAIANVQGPSQICVGSPAQFSNGTLNASDFIWNFGDGQTSTAFQPSHVFNSVGNFTVSMIASDINDCYVSDTATVNLQIIEFIPPTIASVNPLCLGESVTLNASGSSNLFWLNNATLSNLNGNTAVGTPSNSTTYYVSDFNACGSDTVGVYVNVIVPVAEAGPDHTICIGDSQLLTASGGASYQWQSSNSLSALNNANTVATPTLDEQFFVTITTLEGCEATDSCYVFVEQTVPGGVVYPTINLCLGESVVLQSEEGLSYSWSPSAGLNSTTIQNPTASPSNSITYNVSITNACGEGISEVSVDVIELNVVASEGGTVCLGEYYPIEASGADFYSWIPFSSVVNSSASSTLANAPFSQWITVVGTDVNGCADTDSLYMNILSLPEVDAGPDQYFDYPGSTTLFGNTFGLAYNWFPSSGLSCTDCAYPNAVPSAPTWYYLTTTNNTGCIGIDSVYVRPYFPVYVPNALTPNGDGVNDVFFVVGENLTGFHLQIFDRWGIMVFETNNPNEPWLAGYKGYFVPNDVYTWKLSFDSLERRQELIGHVTVIR
jgi:gliding motility-associated-like protein